MAVDNMSALHIAQGGDNGVELYLDDIPGAQEVITLSIIAGFLPTESNEIIRIDYLNEYVKVAGKAAWENGQLELVDYADRPTANSIRAWRQKVYDPQNGRIGLAKAYKKPGSIILIAPDESTTREWQLIGCWPAQVNWGKLDMAARDALVRMVIMLSFDKAIFVQPLPAKNFSLSA